METKEAVLEAQIEVMGHNMEEMQLTIEERMDAQEKRMNERMDARADDVAVLEAQIEVMD